MSLSDKEIQPNFGRAWGVIFLMTFLPLYIGLFFESYLVQLFCLIGCLSPFLFSGFRIHLFKVKYVTLGVAFIFTANLIMVFLISIDRSYQYIYLIAAILFFLSIVVWREGLYEIKESRR